MQHSENPETRGTPGGDLGTELEIVQPTPEIHKRIPGVLHEEVPDDERLLPGEQKPVDKEQPLH